MFPVGIMFVFRRKSETGVAVVVDVVVAAAVVVVDVVVGLQHSYASISFQSPTLGLLLWRIRLPGITLPLPS
jgi:hypothetical protein